MRSNRRPDELRDVRVTPGWNRHAEGSALVEWGRTKVLATVTVAKRLPPHLRGRKGKGWLTAEYALLPRSTAERTQRERLYAGGRTQEIQRLIGRSLRAVTDLDRHFAGRTLIVDVDVLDADGGTRCAGVLAGYAALHHLADRAVRDGELSEWPLRFELAAVSAGIVDGERMLDLDYDEDVRAEADLNVIATGDGRVMEVQGGGEERPLAADTWTALVTDGVDAAQRLLEIVRPQLR